MLSVSAILNIYYLSRKTTLFFAVLMYMHNELCPAIITLHVLSVFLHNFNLLKPSSPCRSLGGRHQFNHSLNNVLIVFHNIMTATISANILPQGLELDVVLL